MENNNYSAERQSNSLAAERPDSFNAMDLLRDYDTTICSDGNGSASSQTWGSNDRQFALGKGNTASYEVQKGDTLWAIASDTLQEMNKVNAGYHPSNKEVAEQVNAILKVNPDIKNPDRIYPGDSIRIPEDTAVQVQLAQIQHEIICGGTQPEDNFGESGETETESSDYVSAGDLADYVSNNFEKLDADNDGWINDNEIQSAANNNEGNDRTLIFQKALLEQRDNIEGLFDDEVGPLENDGITRNDLAEFSSLVLTDGENELVSGTNASLDKARRQLR